MCLAYHIRWRTEGKKLQQNLEMECKESLPFYGSLIPFLASENNLVAKQPA